MNIVNVFVYTLLLLNICIFIMCIMLLRIRPKVLPPKGSHHAIQHPYTNDSETIDYNTLKQKEREQIKILYPELPIVFEEVECDKSFILRFKGLSKKDKYVLYVFENDNAKSAFFTSLERMVENGDTPLYNILVSVVYDNNSNEDVLQAISSYKLKYIYTDDSGLNNLPETEGSTAFIGIGKKPYAILNITNEQDDHEWLSTLNTYRLFNPVFTSISKEATQQLKDTMPFYTKFSLLLTPLFNNSIMYQYMMKYPETISWFLPVLDKEDKKIVVYTVDEESLKETIEKIKESALKQHIVIEVEKEYTQMNQLSEESETFETLKDIIHSTLHTQYELPILIENYSTWSLNVPVISFSPLQEGQITNLHYAISYYTKLLEFKKKA